ncbi:LOW QUALITY PROTEIN: protein DOWN-REGULATED IN DIF1 11-like [Prunus avium]|uniref:LOW QUALITY PROTEIN: protein DOWN-REGULATED IN DIF1 11-like n=1 Tax=Prunus avium TaxID=42229 RepID=A0A6P5SRT7_PRUAV|nr:LOW QUALITY PROTEIN: protein DOWN-REGULATED IN DIF1 11-like [Prunus avium]
MEKSLSCPVAEHGVDDTDFLPIVPPEPYPGYYKFLRECTKHMTPPCAKEIFAGMFRDKPLTRNCCRHLVHMGHDCHNGLVKFLLLNPRLKENASKAYPKSLQIRKECVSTVDVDSPAPAD